MELRRGRKCDMAKEVTFIGQFEEIRCPRKKISKSQNTVGERAGAHRRATQIPRKVKA